MFFPLTYYVAPNGMRYPRVGGRRGRRFAGTSFQPRKRLENAQSPTRRVHAVLGGSFEKLLFIVDLELLLLSSIER